MRNSAYRPKSARKATPTRRSPANRTTLTVLGVRRCRFRLDEPAGESCDCYRYLDARRAFNCGFDYVPGECRCAVTLSSIETPTIDARPLVPADCQRFTLPQRRICSSDGVGMERYQITTRTSRADRQPRFAQLDMEMSFVDAEDLSRSPRF